MSVPLLKLGLRRVGGGRVSVYLLKLGYRLSRVGGWSMSLSDDLLTFP